MKTRTELAQQLFRGTGAELGVASGKFSAVILAEDRVRRLYSIDRWNDHHGVKEYFAASLLLSKTAQETGSTIYDEPPNVSIVLRMTFAEACPLFPAEHFDFLYIDGYAHTGQEGGQTLRDWWPKLKPGGIFAGHDYHPTFQPTIDAVDAFVREHGLELNLTTEDALPSWWVVKPATREST